MQGKDGYWTSVYMNVEMQRGLNHGLSGASKLGVNGRFGVGGPAALARVSALSDGLVSGRLHSIWTVLMPLKDSRCNCLSSSVGERSGDNGSSSVLCSQLELNASGKRGLPGASEFCCSSCSILGELRQTLGASASGKDYDMARLTRLHRLACLQ